MEDKDLKTNESNDKGESDNSPLKLRGLYSKVKISVKTLDYIIAVLVACLILCVVIGLTSHNGFTVTFNTMGGSYIEYQKHDYGDYVEVKEPTREGYSFDHWALDEACSISANLDTMIVDTDFTLYACWLKND